MKMLFLTGLYPRQDEQYYYECSNGSLQNASNVFQWSVVNGLFENKCDFTVVSFPSLPCFLKGYKKIITRPSDIIYNDKIIGHSLRYITIPFIKEWSIEKSLKNYIKKWIEEQQIGENDKFIVLFYHLYGPFLAAVQPLMKQYNRMILCPIITDLFHRDVNKLSKYPFWKRVQLRKEIKITNNMLPLMDKFVFLAGRMSELIPNSRSKYIVVEGIAQNIPDFPPKKEKQKEKTLLYTGALGVHTSIDHLLQAFVLTDNKDFRLVICGDGALRPLVEEYCTKDNRIVYKGSVPRDEALLLQKESTAVINPRRPDIIDTAYSFPSKTIEYLLSGTPMIGFKLEGIPSEYYDYYYTIPDMNDDTMAIVITEVLNKPQEELHQKAISAYNFIINNKTAPIQTKKIIDFLESD